MNFKFKGFVLCDLKPQLLIFVFFLLSNYAAAQECDECSRPRIGLYDFSMMAMRPDPDSVNEIKKYFELFWPGVSSKAYVRNNEPDKNCLSWWDGAMINAFTLQDGRLRFGTEYTNLPPAGPISSVDYILWGHTIDNGGRYQSTLLLEASESRELVKSVSVTFDNNTESVTNAGKSLADQFGSILKVIKDFERYKRDTDNSVAIRDYENKDTKPEIKITPAKLKVETEESVDIKIELIDCDGVPLGNRKVYFADTTVSDMEFSGTTLGKVEPSVVITDEAGKADVKFTAGKVTGLAQISAFFPHFKPNGRAGGFISTSPILIGNPPDKRWVLQAKVTEELIRQSDTSWSEGNQHGVSSRYERRQGTASITGFVKNGSIDTSFYAVYYAEYGYPIENCSVSGFGSVDYFRKYILEWEDPLPKVDIENNRYRGAVEEESTGFEFHYPTEPGDIVVAAISGGMAKGRFSWTHSVYFPEREIKHETSTGSASFNVSATFLDGECSVTRTDSAYMISGSRTSVEKKHVSGLGLETTTLTYTLKASLRSDGALTGINKGTDNTLKDFVLEQNYPNPFNPNTVISYQIPENAKVTLKIFNILGSEIKILVNSEHQAGRYKVNFNAENLPSGIYFYSLECGGKQTARRMLLLR